MSKARDEFYLWNKTTLPMRDEVCNNYVSELEQQNISLEFNMEDAKENARIFINECNELRSKKIKLEQQKEELVGALSLALDQNRRRMYLEQIKQTLNKYSKE